jgi:DNA-directed RNA polymerase subunit K/omega
LEEEQRQVQIRGLVNLATEIGLRIAREVLEKPSLYNELRFPPNMPDIRVNNAIRVMTVEAKTKGALANVGQILGAVGQQNYRGKPFVPTLSGGRRVLPTTDMDDDRPESRGFISSSFMSGLSPEELFLLQKGGRENLLDTALKTAETGTIQRRMSKAFETLHVSADGSVRNTIGTMFAPIYNNGYRIGNTVMVQNQDGTSVPSFMDIKAAIFHLNTKRGWVPKNVEEKIEKNKQILEDDPTFNSNKEDYPMTKPEEEQEEVPSIIKKKKKVTTKKQKEISEAEKFEVYQPKYKENTSGVRKLSRFEKVRIIGTRATQLANNSAPLVEVDPEEHDPVVIATKEYYAGVLDLYIIRRFTDGSYQKVKPTLENIQ